jgi:hypothetical protein
MKSFNFEKIRIAELNNKVPVFFKPIRSLLKRT